MSEWKQKRFWKYVTTNHDDSGHWIELDGRRVKTPAKSPLNVPTEAMARAIAAEWDGQNDIVNPMTMPFTRTANAAIDKVALQHGEVAEMLAAYGDSDLLCYRAEAPEALVQRQQAQWDPALEWGALALGANLVPRAGVMHEPQDKGSMNNLSEQVHALSDFKLAAFHDLVTLTGSLILGFAAARDWRAPDQVWELSRLDESWQEEQWGIDEEARELAESKKQAFFHAKKFFDLS